MKVSTTSNFVKWHFDSSIETMPSPSLPLSRESWYLLQSIPNMVKASVNDISLSIFKSEDWRPKWPLAILRGNRMQQNTCVSCSAAYNS
ncbi:MAG: hypothetical protein ACTS6A_01675, partial [Candidatus Hodgkinia cicadicola]